jgi:hypothetical protein
MGRWVCFAKMYPQYLISAQKAVILHQDWTHSAEYDPEYQIVK